MNRSVDESLDGALPGEPAIAGTYGLAPEGFRLPPATRLGPVRLQVGDLARSLAFYGGVLGLALLDRAPGRTVLGTASPERQPLVELVERSGARPAPGRRRTGLFHFALLLPDRPALARFVRHLEEIGVRPAAGDHLVSEAFYLQDPDNLGIEVYADRPRTVWRRIGRELMMATDPVDVPALVAAAGNEPWQGMPAGTVMGHVHLHVGDLATAATFYSGSLGFDRTVWSYPGALFLAAGGYHHHLGTNIWAGKDPAPPSPEEAQLLEWTLELPDPGSAAALVGNLAGHGHGVEPTSDLSALPAVTVRDPWGTRVRLQHRTPAFV